MKDIIAHKISNIKDKIIVYSKHKQFMNFILYGNFIFITIFAIMIVLLVQNKTSDYFNVRETLSNLKTISDNYNQKLIEAQITFKPDIEGIHNLSAKIESERKKIINLSDNINNETYTHDIKNYINILNKRLMIKSELINQYSVLSDSHKDYLIAGKNAEIAVGNNIPLQLTLKHIMLDLENVRLISRDNNRNFIIDKIQTLKNKLINHSPLIQEKVGLFVDVTENIVKLLRYLDTMRYSMQSDNHNQQLEYLDRKTSEYIDYEHLKFSGKLFLFLALSIVLLLAQFTILTLFFINKKRTEKIQAEAHDTILKSKEVTERAKMYAMDAQRNQYKLLHDFCGDFNAIITNISSLSNELKYQTSQVDQYDIHAIETQKISIITLNQSIIALDRWLNNYLDVYTAKDKWAEIQNEVIDFTELFDKHFAEARFFLHDQQHLMSIFHSKISDNVMIDKQYVLKVFLNMMYISLKWSQDNWIKSSITVTPSTDTEASLEISIINGGSEDIFQKGEALLHKEKLSLEGTTDNDTNNANSDDRFIMASFYYMQQICDILQAKVEYKRTILEENSLSIHIPVQLNTQEMQDIGVPILKNKNILIISAFSPILRSLEKQLQSFGLNVTTLSDRYSAIGHIIGMQDAEATQYDLFIIDHNPPDIDAEALTKIIRENSHKNLAHIIVIATEQYAAKIDQYKSFYDAHFIKPIMPQLLKSKLEEFVNIQLYGIQDTEEDINNDGKKEKRNTRRFLTVMDDDLSSMLLQLILTKTDIEVDIASSSAQLFECLEDNVYDFVLASNQCSWILPDNLAKDLRRHHTDNKDSVLILFYDTLKDVARKKLKHSGYDDFIPLPLSRSVFLSMMEKWQDPMAQRLEQDAENIDEETPEIETPEIETPEIETPEIEKPEIETPEIETPEIETPEIETPEPKKKLPPPF
jgi:PleD family two-component response regulator